MRGSNTAGTARQSSPREPRLSYVCFEFIEPGRASATHVSEIRNGLRRRGWRVAEFDAPLAPGSAPGLLRRLGAAARVYAKAGRICRADAIYVRAHVLAFPVALVAWLKRIPVIHELNGPFSEMQMVRPWLRPLRRVLEVLVRFQFRTSAAVIAVTRELGEEARDFGASCVEVIPNGVNPDIFFPRSETGPYSPAGPYVVFFGSLAPWQGVEVMLAAPEDPAWPPELTMLIVGSGAESAQVEAAAQRLERVSWIPYLKQSDLAAVVGCAVASLSVQTTFGDRHRFGLSPLKVYEAMACGVPVIVSDIAGQRDLIEAANAGLVIRCGDPRQLAGAVAQLWNDAQTRDDMAANALDESARHTWDVRSETTHDLLARVVVA